MEAAAEQAEREFGPIDLWVNNAMVSMYSPFMDMTPEEFKHVVEVTFLGNAYGTHARFKRMMSAIAGRSFRLGPPSRSGLSHCKVPTVRASMQFKVCSNPSAANSFIKRATCKYRSSTCRAEHHAIHLDEKQNAAQGPPDRHDL